MIKYSIHPEYVSMYATINNLTNRNIRKNRKIPNNSGMFQTCPLQLIEQTKISRQNIGKNVKQVKTIITKIDLIQL